MISQEDKAGIYITIIVHLVVILILLAAEIGAQWKKETSFLLDFTKEEEREMLQKEEEERLEQEAFDEEVARRIDDLISGRSQIQFRNTAVNRSTLKDDRGTDAQKLYEDADKLAQELRNGFSVDEPDEDYARVARNDKKDDAPVREYTGPSVVSYDLGGRKASRLPIPAYKCIGGGMVTVIIGVDNAGNVVAAKVQDEVSSSDRCLREFAVRAAKLSRFSSDPNAPARQMGNIVYQFIAQ